MKCDSSSWKIFFLLELKMEKPPVSHKDGKNIKVVNGLEAHKWGFLDVQKDAFESLIT